MSTNTKSANKTNWLLLLLTVAIAIIPLVINSGAEYGGADGEAESAITEINPSYEPWFNSFYEPPSGEIESLLFSIQAALGAGVIGYYLGSRKKR
ncbi:energy-coupling factor ABC transporter substrate-binding protein [Romboutsia weinsteinii]|uniref:Cobalt transport protein CbiN n=1 Tax=Romboutsia weinsteinii TaxID=2020949 RepID=A0A371IY33_9FIRM|nr:energy-coupling factor ABC transporter substrate-binding protein [Romboutsia weinsteinii]RDY25378.1 energy-coupling factor ABC transporter substrate-binding protein [Romboutsia weinsteinii]